MPYDFLIETYDTERIKVLSVWSEFTDEDLPVHPRPGDPRGRSVHEQMVHQCVSEDLWFRGMLGIDVDAPPLPQHETRLAFIRRYAEDSGKRLVALRDKRHPWWEEGTTFFDVRRPRAWVMMPRPDFRGRGAALHAADVSLRQEPAAAAVLPGGAAVSRCNYSQDSRAGPGFSVHPVHRVVRQTHTEANHRRPGESDRQRPWP